MDKIDRYGDLAIFVKVSDLGGFGAAAKDLGVSTSHTSRAVQRVEDRVGARLMNRTTRRIALTDAGRALVERARALLADLDEAETAITDLGGEPRGTLRITLPVYFGTRYVAPLAAEFAARHQGLSMELAFEDRRVDLIAEGLDLAVRIGTMVDSSLVARRLGRTRALTVASEAYLAARGTPTHPSQLADHDTLLYALDSQGPAWRYAGAEGEVSVRVHGRFASNSGQALREAANAGLGVVRLPDVIVAEDVRAGRLRRILTDWEADMPISAVYPPGRHLSPKVRKFVDFLAERLAEAPWLQCSGDCAADVA